MRVRALTKHRPVLAHSFFLAAQPQRLYLFRTIVSSLFSPYFASRWSTSASLVGLCAVYSASISCRFAGSTDLFTGAALPSIASRSCAERAAVSFRETAATHHQSRRREASIAKIKEMTCR